MLNDLTTVWKARLMPQRLARCLCSEGCYRPVNEKTFTSLTRIAFISLLGKQLT